MTQVATIESINLIATDPTVRGGQPCIAGTGLRVADVVIAQLFHRRSPDEIAGDYEISLAQVYAALSYYFQHKDRLDGVIRQQFKTARLLKEQNRGNPAALLSG
ncbi:MAG: DUF433 domain-containing protein [Caldilineaceae bacterium]|nr:DUF433 domain-containing protein [Caldilineaceae bacterium]